MLFIISILILMMIAFTLIFLCYGANFLITRDNIDNVNNAVIVLLMGSVADRSLGAADLFNNSRVSKILMVHSPSPGIEILESRGVHLEDISKISKRVLIELGISEKDIIILPGNTKSTKDEALAVKKYIDKNKGFDSLILVTSKFHSSRSKYIFNSIFKKSGTMIYSHPTSYDNFKVKGWYRNQDSAKNVFLEYLKWCYFILIKPFQVK